MSSSDLGDKAGRLLCDAITDQLTVTELDLSSNKLSGAAFGESLRGLLENNSVLQRYAAVDNKNPCRHFNTTHAGISIKSMPTFQRKKCGDDPCLLQFRSKIDERFGCTG